MFVTTVKIKPLENPIGYTDRIFLMGSCFAENMGNHLAENKFPITANPFGTLFNPLSIAQSIERSISGECYCMDDLFEHQGQYHSFDFHSKYSNVCRDKMLSILNEQVKHSQKALKEANTLIVTFGSAYAYFTIKENNVVANCHKLPENSFCRKLLTIEQITDQWNKLIQKLPHVDRIIFTVSPIRHLRDGLHENQISKATLLLATDQIIQANAQSHYFPAYEIVQDELRDYRYYDADMSHPSAVAIDYIFERFKESFISSDSYPTIAKCAQISSDLRHRPFSPHSHTYLRFLQNTKKRIETLLEHYPQIDYSTELKELQIRIAQFNNP